MDSILKAEIKFSVPTHPIVTRTKIERSVSPWTQYKYTIIVAGLSYQVPGT